MILTIVAVVLGVAGIIAFLIGAKYTTSPLPEAKLSAFAIDDSPRRGKKSLGINTRDDGDASRPPRYAPNLSIVIPCYNEEERLPVMMDQTLKFGKETVEACRKLADTDKSRELGHFGDFEIIVVDDCSKDGTVKMFEKYREENPTVKMSCVKVSPNRGKGFAVRSGFLASSGDYVLMADGDGATQISDVCKLIAALRADPAASAGAKKTADDGGDTVAKGKAVLEEEEEAGAKNKKTSHDKRRPFIAVGSRAHLEAEATAKRTFFRTILMKAFHLVVQVAYLVGTRGSFCTIHDTQCGFKLFDRRICENIFLNNRLERFAFDVELFILAKKFNIRAVEIPVNWVEVPGSKVNVKAMVQMGMDCLLMCFTYGLGYWRAQRGGHF